MVSTFTKDNVATFRAKSINSNKQIAYKPPSPTKRSIQVFTNQKTGQKYATLLKLDKAIFEYAGDIYAIPELLKSYFKSKHGKLVYEDIITKEEGKKLDAVMANIKSLRDNSPNISKNTILSCVASEFSRETLNQRFKVNVSAKSFTKARKIAKTKGIGKFFKRKTVTKKLSVDTVNTIREFYYNEDITREAANRTVKIGKGNNKVTIAVRYLQSSMRNAYLQYCEKVDNEDYPCVSFSSFRNLKPKEIKKAKRDTDLCPICVEGKRIRALKNNLERRLNLSDEEIKQLNDITANLQAIDRHIELERTLRAEFNKQKTSLRKGDAVLVMDFKENMGLGKGQQESSRNFYNSPHRSVFTIAVYTKDDSNTTDFRNNNNNNKKQDNQKKNYKINYFTFISECLDHDSGFVLDCLNTLVESDKWKKLNITRNINLWMDNAPQHFRTFELLYGYFKLATEKLHSNSLHLNYFAEYHGKCVCDSHFSLLSRYYRDYTMSKDYKDPIYSTDSFIKLLENSVANSNLCVEKLNQKRKETTSPYPYLHVKFFKYERKLVPSSVNQIKANGFTSFYHFFLSRNDNAVNDSENESYVLNAKVHKGHPFTHEYKTKITLKLNEKKTKQGWSESQQTEEFSVASLLRKENFVKECAIDRPKRGRGRPRKQPTSADIPDKTTQPKRGRGRPKKQSTSANNPDENTSKRGRGRPRKETTSKTTPNGTSGRSSKSSTSKKQPKSALRYELEDDISEPLEFVNDARSIQQVRHYMQLIANLERRNYDPNNIDAFTTEFVFATTPSKPGNNDFND